MTDPDADNTLQGRRVLVVEDELLVAMKLDCVLRAQGCTVLGPAASVDRAAVLIGEGQPQVALPDLNLERTVGAAGSRGIERPRRAQRDDLAALCPGNLHAAAHQGNADVASAPSDTCRRSAYKDAAL